MPTGVVVNFSNLYPLGDFCLSVEVCNASLVILFVALFLDGIDLFHNSLIKSQLLFSVLFDYTTSRGCSFVLCSVLYRCRFDQWTWSGHCKWSNNNFGCDFADCDNVIDGIFSCNAVGSEERTCCLDSNVSLSCSNIGAGSTYTCRLCYAAIQKPPKQFFSFPFCL